MTQPRTELRDGPPEGGAQISDTGRERLFALARGWGDAVDGTCASSSCCSDVQLQQERE